MAKRLFVFAAILAVIFSTYQISTKAADWPSRNLNQTLNRQIVDPSVINSAVAPFSLDVYRNSQDMVAGGGYFYYSDGASQSTIYAISLSSHQAVWSKQFPKQINRLLLDDDRLYFGTDNFYCLNALSGEIIWATSPGKLGTLSYNAQVYQFDRQNIYGFRQYSNIYKLAILDKSSGAVVFYSELSFNDFINDVAVWNNNLFISSGRSGSSPSSSLHRFNLSNLQLETATQTCRSNAAKMIVDGENNQVVLTANNAAICSYRIDDFSAIAINRMVNLERFIKYNDRYYTIYDDYFKSLPVADTNANVSQTRILPSSGTESFVADPLMVNENFFAATNAGNIWSKNLETGETKLSNILVPSSAISPLQIIYSNGYLITRFNTSENVQKIIFCDINNLTAAPTYQFTVTSPYHTEGMNQYLGQLHAHLEVEKELDFTKTIKNQPTITAVETRYRDAGYDFIALTEHNKILPNPAVTGILHVENSEEITQGKGGDHILAIGINEAISPDGSDQERIDAVKAQGGIPILAHPNSKQYPFTLSRLFDISGYRLIEIRNAALQRLNASRIWGNGTSTDKWDKLLSVKRDIYGSANDDYTPYDGGFDGGAIVVNSKSGNQADIMESIRQGNFYAVQGSAAPRVNISLDTIDNKITVDSDRLSGISFIGFEGRVLQKVNKVTSATYQINGNETYVRAEIVSDGFGKKTWTQPIFIDTRVNYSNLSIGYHDITTSDAEFHIDTTGESSIEAVPVSSLPSVYPPAGHLSTVYSLQTNGSVNSGNLMTYSYSGIQLPTNPENLKIFTYNESQLKWEPVESSLDLETKTVTAALPHFSLYTLSAHIPEDNEKPTISLVAPADLSNFSGTVNLSADAHDNQAVTNVRFIVDNREINSDIIASDGWTAQLDTSILTTGNHKLLLEAEDFAGNIGNAENDIIVSGGITAPAITITEPTTSDFLHDSSAITGSYTSQLDLKDVNIYLDDIYIDKTDINLADNTFSKLIDWSQFIDGVHKLKLELQDMVGNIAVAERNINIGQNVQAVIDSPDDGQSYLRNQSIQLQVTATPVNSDIKILFDGAEMTNNSALDLIDYSLGEHNVQVKFRDQIIASSTFNITTNYQDTISMVQRLENDGHFTNHGIPTAIIAQLRSAQLAHILGLQKIEDLILQELLKFIEQQSNVNKPKIDQLARIIVLENVEFLSINF